MVTVPIFLSVLGAFDKKVKPEESLKPYYSMGSHS